MGDERMPIDVIFTHWILYSSPSDPQARLRIGLARSPYNKIPVFSGSGHIHCPINPVSGPTSRGSFDMNTSEMFQPSRNGYLAI